MAAALAGAGVLLALTSLRPSPAVLVDIGPDPSSLRPGEVAVPVTVSSSAIARTLVAGDLIDVVGLSGTDGATPRASVIAPRTRVLEVPDSASTFGSSASAVILLAVRESDALELSAVTAQGPVAVLIRTKSIAR